MTEHPLRRWLTRLTVLVSCLPYALVLLSQERKDRRAARHHTRRDTGNTR
ncbi:hypothetical protein [Streptomyces sp. AN091965]|nr:hypothetical protein [Streptomyces sp. AN091965]MCI3927742.1 hypothetical protein [Streptomyces sp. AN091965]